MLVKYEQFGMKNQTIMNNMDLHGAFFCKAFHVYIDVVVYSKPILAHF